MPPSSTGTEAPTRAEGDPGSASAGTAADSRCAGEGGSASLEFLTLGLLLLIPVLYLVVAMAAVHGAALATEGAARHSARVFVRAGDEHEARLAISRALSAALADTGVDAERSDVVVQCAPDPSSCLTRGGTVTVTVTAFVPMPLVPDVLDLPRRLTVPVTATATGTVSRFWSGS